MRLEAIRQQVARLLKPPVFEDDEETTRIARLTYIIALFMLAVVVTIGGYFRLVFPADQGLERVLFETALPGLVAVLTLVLLRARRVQLANWVFLGAMSALFFYLSATYGGVAGPEFPRIVLLPVFAGLFLGGRAAFITAGICVLASLGLLYGEQQGWLPLFDVVEVAGDYTQRDFWIYRSTEFLLAALALYLTDHSIRQSLAQARENAAALSAANLELEVSQAALQLRTADLERRSAYLEASTEVGRAVASILDTDTLLTQVDEIIRVAFDLYFVGLFLGDATDPHVTLRTGTGASGQALVARKFSLPINEASSVGWSMLHGRAHTCQEDDPQMGCLFISELPDARSEVALPLRSRGQTLGVLLGMSRRPDAFTSDLVAVLQPMADQVAQAIDNARLFAETQAALEAERRAYGQVEQEAWAQLLRTGDVVGVRYAGKHVAPIGDLWTPEMQAAVQQGERVVVGTPVLDEARHAFAVPIKVRGQTIGVVNARRKAEGGMWSEEEMALLDTLVEQLSVALESARLYEDTQRRAAQEQLVGEVASRMRESLDVEKVLQTTVQELGRAVGASEVNIRLVSQEDL